MSDPAKERAAALRTYAVGYAGSLALTAAAFVAVRWPSFASRTTFGIVLVSRPPSPPGSAETIRGMVSPGSLSKHGLPQAMTVLVEARPSTGSGRTEKGDQRHVITL